jgi:hypothetical protein
LIPLSSDGPIEIAHYYLIGSYAAVAGWSFACRTKMTAMRDSNHHHHCLHCYCYFAAGAAAVGVVAAVVAVGVVHLVGVLVVMWWQVEVNHYFDDHDAGLCSL